MLALVRHFVSGQVGQRRFVCGLEIMYVVWNDKTAVWTVLSLPHWVASYPCLSCLRSKHAVFWLFSFFVSFFVFSLKLSSCLYFHLVIFYSLWVFMSVLHAWTSVYYIHAWCPRRWCSSLWVTMGIEPESFATRVLNHWVYSPFQCPGS